MTPKTKGRSRVKPTTLSRPPTEAEEWLLVKAWLTITEVERDGGTWRAEAALRSGETLPVVGLAGADIAGELLEPGRRARITGIVRRAHPSATDQRFALAPRSRQDIRLGALSDDEQGDDDGGDGEGDDEDDLVAWSGSGVGADGVVAAALGSLASLDDRVVRVGGRVEDITEQRLTIDDGTATGVVRIPQRVAPILPEPKVGEVVNATGRVKRRTGGRREVVIDSAADLRRAASLVFAQDEVIDQAQLLEASRPSRATGSPLGATAGDVWFLPWLAAGALAASVALAVLVALALWWMRRQPSAATARSRPSLGPRGPSAG